MNFSIKADLEAMGMNLDALSAGVQESIRLQVGQLAMAAKNEWIRLAQSRLNTSREDYIHGLRQSESFRVFRSPLADTYEISLVGQFPNNLEFGMGPFDMKSVRPGWLGGKKAKIGKDGSSYVTIPFRHSTANSSRFDYTGKAAAISSPTLKTQLKNTAKAYGLDRMIRTATGKVMEGTVKRMPPKQAGVHPYLQGMVRIQQASAGVTKKGLGRGSGTLMTFRRMSTKSDASKWIHPGLEAANLLMDVESYVQTEMSNIARNIIGVR